MSEIGRQKLHSLLFHGSRELVNLQLFPGTGNGLTADALGGATADALHNAMNAWENGMPSQAPCTGLNKRTVKGS